MFKYLRFPFLSGATIEKGSVLTNQDQRSQHTVPPLPVGQAILDKTGHQNKVEAEDPKIETNNLRLGSSGDQSGRALTNVNPEVIQPSPIHQHAHHSPIVERMATPLRNAPQGANTEAGESSHRSVFYAPEWSIHRRCRVDTPMWCRELMVHLAPPVAQKESNALNNATALERAWFSLARGALAQIDVLERFENLQADFGRLVESHTECKDMAGKLVPARLDLEHSSHLYTSLSDRYKAFKSNNEGCVKKLEGLENHNRELSQVNKD
nr:hypothetical protein [Tanacetum cinerariifolium]